MKPTITIALSKGRLLPPTINLLKRIGIRSPDLRSQTRKLYIQASRQPIGLMIVRAVDVPTYVEYGAADLGIAGHDSLLEQGVDVYEPLDLKFGKCQIVLAAPTGPSARARRRGACLRVATKYPAITERFFSERGIPVEVIKLYGSIELAPMVRLADQVVDLTATGSTLKANNLRILEEIARSTARLIVNRASMKLKYDRIQPLIEKLRKALQKDGS